MNKKNESTRRLLELQGFYNVAEKDLKSVDLGLRVAPVICAAAATVATIAGSAYIFWSLLPLAILGGILKGHPFDVLYNHGLRYLLDGPRLPHYAPPRRFACLMAAAWAVATALCFQYGFVLAGQILGASLAVTALVPVTTGFCVPSFLLRLVTGKLSFSWMVHV